MNHGSVLVKVLRIRCLYAYPSCTLCHRKVRKLHEEDGRLWCSTCFKFYSEKSVHYRYHVNLIVTDYSGIASVTVFGKSLDSFFGMTATEFCRYVLKCCGRKNSIQGFDIDKVVHLAMERCFVGKMVYLTFRLTNHTTSKNICQSLKGNLLPNSKVTNVIGSGKMPELVANVICKVHCEEKEKSIADILMEYLRYFETSSVSENWTIPDDFTVVSDGSDSFANKEKEISSDEASNCVVGNVSSPRHFFWKSSHVNKLMLSIMSSEDDSNNDSANVLGNLSSDLENIQSSLSLEPDQVLEMKSKRTGFKKSSIICEENLTLADLQQSFCRKPNTNDSCVWTTIREDSSNMDSYHGNLAQKGSLSPESVSENGHPKSVCLSEYTAGHGSKSGPQLNGLKEDRMCCKKMHEKAICAREGSSGRNQYKDSYLESCQIMLRTPNVKSVSNEFEWMFDSPNSEDLDIFLAQVSLTWLSTKPRPSYANVNEQGFQNDNCYPEQPRSSSDLNVGSNDVLTTCFTSTPSLTTRSNDQVFDLEDFINTTFSPIYSESVSAPLERNTKGIARRTPVMFGKARKRQSKLGSSSVPTSKLKGTSDGLCSATPRKTKCQESQCKVSSKKKGKHKSKNLLRCILNTGRSSQYSRNSSLEKTPQSSKKSPDVTLVRHTCSTPETWTKNSWQLFENESDVNGSTEEENNSTRRFEEISANPIPVCTDISADGPSSSHNNGHMLSPNNNKVCEQLTSTCSSPLLFSQP